jgi:hypothetical protein
VRKGVWNLQTSGNDRVIGQDGEFQTTFRTASQPIYALNIEPAMREAPLDARRHVGLPSGSPKATGRRKDQIHHLELEELKKLRENPQKGPDHPDPAAT